MSLPNRYHLRRVAESSARACFICYKPSSSVLITPDNRDYFYICPIHLTDKGFCSPVIDEEALAEKKRKEALEREIEKVKKEYEEKLKRKEKEKRDEESKGKNKDDAKIDEEDRKKAEKEKNDKIKSIQAAAGKAATVTGNAPEDMPRIYTLHKTFYQARIERMRQAEIAKRNRERLKDASNFPSPPKSDF
ncbi:hypothetical protein VTO42DRAFT_8784 [Malbranchea cinnamomea]